MISAASDTEPKDVVKVRLSDGPTTLRSCGWNHHDATVPAVVQCMAYLGRMRRR